MAKHEQDFYDFVKDHVRRYLETDGEDGHDWNGRPCLLLTTRGRKSGEPRQLPVIYGRDGDEYLLIGSKGRDDQHPQWFLNLRADPNVELQVGAERFKATTRVADAGEHDRLWRIMVGNFPNYESYQAKTERQLPVVILTCC